MNTQITITNLPDDLQNKILNYVDPSETYCVCKKWSNISLAAERTLALLVEQAESFALTPILNKIDFIAPTEKKLQDIFSYLFLRMTRSEFALSSKLNEKAKTYVLASQLLHYEKARNLCVVWGQIEPQLSKNCSIVHNNLTTTKEKARLIRSYIESHPENLKTIKNLLLRACRLTLLPEELNLFPNIEHFMTGMNSIDSVPSDFGKQWNQLKSFSLTNSLLCHLPENFGFGWNNVTEIDLSLNKMEALPDTFGKNCNKLSTLNLSANKIKSLPLNVGENWSQLNSLDLTRNQIEEINPSILKQWKNLEFFYFADNPGSNQARWIIFSQCPKLKYFKN